MSKLLTRDEFRTAVFARDGGRCVACQVADVPLDAHHILERRLFPDGGYYLDNGVTLCDGGCHLLAEQTVLSCELLRERAGITKVILPPHLYADQRYDKWSNPILEGTPERRLRGELFDDDSVKKVLAQGGKLSLFSPLVKYPRTYHLPWSPGATKDDRTLADDAIFFGEPFWDTTAFEEASEGIPQPPQPNPVVVTLKMDGENTTWYREHMHARSLDYAPHPSRNIVKALWAGCCGDIPDGWRVCGENVYAKHSIAYTDLAGYFQMFSIWNERNECLPWTETVEWAALLGLPTVPVLYAGLYDRVKIEWLFSAYKDTHEGYVIRNAGRFHYRDFRTNVGKYVRAGHVQTHGHWMRERVVPNQLSK